MAHFVTWSEEYRQILDKLFIDNFLMTLHLDQLKAFQDFLTAFRKSASVQLAIVNDVDFDPPDTFTFINHNIFKDSGNSVMRGPKEPSTGLSLEVFKTKNRGWGIKTLAPIQQNNVVLECVGELLDKQQFTKQPNKSHIFPKNIEYIEGTFYVDASKFGNLSRFINHSCEPNCRILNMNIHTLRDIKPGEELTIDFTNSNLPAYFVECLCGSTICKKIF